MAVALRSVESESKNTRSPTFTTKSCALPGVAAPPAPKPFAPAPFAEPSGFEEQAATLSANTAAAVIFNQRGACDNVNSDADDMAVLL